MKNKKGFTLVELLAVIVVLAIIMIIAVPAVLNSMTDARKSSFIVYGEKLINAAQAQYQADQLKNGALKTCYNVSELIDGTTGSYVGFVSVSTSGDSTTYTVTLHDNNYMVVAAESTNLEAAKSAATADLKDGVTVSNENLYNYVEDKHNKLYNEWECPTETSTETPAETPAS